MTEQSNPAPRACRRRGRAVLFVMFVALLGGLAGALTTKAFSHGGGRWFLHGSMDPATVDRRIERAIKHAAIEIEASKDQEDKLIVIAKAAAKDLLPLREKMRSARTEVIDLFTRAAVDRAAVEKLRVEQLATFDEIGKRIAKAATDAAEVLTPEQRKALADLLPPGGWHGRWHRR